MERICRQIGEEDDASAAGVPRICMRERAGKRQKGTEKRDRERESKEKTGSAAGDQTYIINDLGTHDYIRSTMIATCGAKRGTMGREEWV